MVWGFPHLIDGETEAQSGIWHDKVSCLVWSGAWDRWTSSHLPRAPSLAPNCLSLQAGRRPRWWPRLHPSPIRLSPPWWEAIKLLKYHSISLACFQDVTESQQKQQFERQKGDAPFRVQSPPQRTMFPIPAGPKLPFFTFSILRWPKGFAHGGRGEVSGCRLYWSVSHSDVTRSHQWP